MQLYPILLIGVLLAWDGGMGLTREHLALGGWTVAAVAWAPVVAVVAAAWLGVLGCRRRLAAGTPRAVVVADRLVRGGRWLLLANHAVAVLVFGWLGTVRGVTGDTIVLDEVVAITPTVAGLLGLWWVYYPIERRVREALLIRRLDEGQAIFAPPGRGAYVLAQVRTHLLFLLVPIFVILAAAESIDGVARRFQEVPWVPWAAETLTLAAALGVVAGAPLLARVVLDLEPLPVGPLHDDLDAICRANRVRVRRLLVWRTHGTMINAAVMGLFGRLRYVLLTDALLEAMSRAQLHAVMAHEIGHIKRHHMPWLVVVLLALVLTPAVAIEAPLTWWGGEAGQRALASPWLGAPAALVLLGLVLGVFGWISRRFERQADTFAACHLSARPPVAHETDDEAGGETITPAAAATVAAALEAIARLESVRPRRWSWRHGSIAWRQAYLASIIGEPRAAPAIDRQVRWIKLAAATCLALSACYLVLAAPP